MAPRPIIVPARETTVPPVPAIVVPFTRLDPRATIPAYQTAGSAGMDLSACLPADAETEPTLVLEPRRIAIVPCGLALAIPPGYEGQVRPRSGLASRHGVTVPNAPGTIDSDYRGEVKVALINLGSEPYTVTQGQRIAQLVISPVVRANMVEVDELDGTLRGSGGFGSTGLR